MVCGAAALRGAGRVLLLGCGVLARGVWLEVLANVAMLPGEPFVRAVVTVWRTDFGVTKVCFDVAMTLGAAALSFVLSGQLHGVREGSLAAALLVGFLARLIGRRLAGAGPRLFGGTR